MLSAPSNAHLWRLRDFAFEVQVLIPSLTVMGYGLPHPFAVTSHGTVEQMKLLKEAVLSDLGAQTVSLTNVLTSEIQAFKTPRAGCLGTEMHLICWHALLQSSLWF